MNFSIAENPWEGKRVLVTGACGTVGSELVRQIVGCDPGEVLGIDNHESGIFFSAESYRDESRVRFMVGDVRDPNTLLRNTDGIDVIIHAAALKHVILSEQAPRDAVQTNIGGVLNVVDAALTNRVERVIFTSSDKAVNPTSVMGTSKLMGERLVTAADAEVRGDRPIFASTRFGNVLGSAGSVIPVFQRQIKAGGPVTLTDPRMSRFIMTTSEAVGLVMRSVFLARGGEVFVTKMPAVKIEDLAHVMIKLLAPVYGRDPDDIEVKEIGVKPGEKLYEELLNEEEARRTIELDDYFVVQPALRPKPSSSRVEGGRPERAPYTSEMQVPMTAPELEEFLVSNDLFGLDREETGQPSLEHGVKQMAGG